MKVDYTYIAGRKVKVISLNTVVVGSGAAGLNAADRLTSFGIEDSAVVTEGINMGTSRNTGSDKQTYYKLTLSGDSADSVYNMAETLFNGGAMDGDIALAEAALSSRCFYRLIEAGVPFPQDRFGQYVGYKTDHDPRQRATSAGPLTSKYMTEALEKQVRQKGIRIFDGYQIIGILTDKEKQYALGLIALNKNDMQNQDERYVIFNCSNIVYAVGGPAGMYSASVYPESQTGASGIAFEAGAVGKNLTESQFGIASVRFRWNLSGTYQQVLPRYVSTDTDGNDEKEFLTYYFETPGELLDAVFLKGYQWPFDPRKVSDYGSSLIDILVYNETVLKGRRVFIDYTQNPLPHHDGNLDFSQLSKEAYDYLDKSGALFGRPIDRLLHMNAPAVELYRFNGIDLSSELLEIAVCAQHNNGGLMGNIWWESNLRHFFPVGEVNGSHGVYRPGGSALNSGQVGSTRAAQYIAARYNKEPKNLQEMLNICDEQIISKIELGEGILQNQCSGCSLSDMRKHIGHRMTRSGAHIRSLYSVKSALEQVKEDMRTFKHNVKISSLNELPEAYKYMDMLITQFVYLSAIEDYINKGGRSRGSYLVYDSNGKLPVEGLDEMFRSLLDDGSLGSSIQLVSFSDGNCSIQWIPVKPIPSEDTWFENIWNDYRNNEIIK